jgi:Putative amidase domain
VTTTSCWAVGESSYKVSEEGDVKGPTALIERWNGSSWSISSVSQPLSQLTGVSCPTTSSCLAVSGQQGLAVQRWNGSAWASESVNTPSGGSNVALADVSCSSATGCTTVGSYVLAGHTAPLAERWNGSSWAVQTTTDPFGVIEEGPSKGATPIGRFEGVSCSSATSCTAFGSYSDASQVTQPLAESWDGTEWGLQPVPAPVESANSATSDVSCFSSFECTAVGYDAGSGTHSMIQTQKASAHSHRITVEAVDKSGGTAVKAIDVDVPAEVAETPECSQKTSSVAPKGTLSSAEALAAVEGSLPEAVGPSVATTEEATEEEINPSYSAPQPNLEATGNLADGETAITPGGGVTLAGVACITPSMITTAATEAKVVNGDAALFANTAPETQTVIRPTAGGVSFIETITGADAPDSLSWNVTVPVGMEMEKLPSGAIAIVRSLEEEKDEGVVDIPEPSGAKTPDALNDARIQAENAEYQLTNAQDETDHEVIAIIAEPWVVLKQEQIEPLLIELAPTEEIPTEYVITVYLPADEADAAFYPIHAHLEATASISGSGRCSGGSPCGEFNAADAAQYAEFWGNPSHPRNGYYVDYGSNNCTNFVSQTLFAGRVRYMRAFERGDGSWWYRNLGSGGVFGEGPSAGAEDTRSWRLADELPRHLWQYGLAHIDKQEPWAWTRGTILAEDWYATDGKGDFNHVQFVVGTEDFGGFREPLIANSSSQGFNYSHKPWRFVKKSIELEHGADWNRIAIVMKHTTANLNDKKHAPDNLYGPNGMFRG